MSGEDPAGSRRSPSTGRSAPDRAAFAVIALAAVVFVPALGVGLYVDDYWWALGDRAGLAPMSIDYTTDRAAWAGWGVGFGWASDSFAWNNARPVAGALFSALLRLVGTANAPWQAVNLVGYLALVAVVWPLYRRHLPGWTAVVALFVFATQFSHMQTVWFSANAHSWLAAIPGVLALRAWSAGRTGWALAGLAAALVVSDSALGVVGYLAAFAVLERSYRRLLPMLAIGAVYVLGHTLLGFGAHGGSLYLDPRVAPGAWLAGILARTPGLVGGAIGVLPADLWVVLPEARPMLVVGGLVGLAVLGGGLILAWPALPAAERHVVKWGALGASLGLPVFLGAPPGGRLLLWATLGTAPIVAVVLAAAARKWRGPPGGEGERREPRARSLALRALAAPVALAVGITPLVIPLQLRGIVGMSAALRIAAEEADIGPERVVALTLPDAMTALYLLPARLVNRPDLPAPGAWGVVSVARAAHRIVRTGPDTLELSVLGGRMWEQPFEQLFLPPDPPSTWAAGPVTVRVLDGGDHPSRVSVTFDPPLDAPGWRLLAWQAGGLARFTPPALGAAVVLEPSRSPFTVR